MKTNFILLTAILFAGLFGTAEASDLTLPVKAVYDGDTIDTKLTNLPVELQKVSIRILGIDTAELKTYKCPAEKELAVKARSRLIELLSSTNNQMVVKNIKWDKYGGRIDGKVYNNQGVDVGQVLISENLAHPYDGGTKSSWCK
jgi:endonuclease YncB( thermonuclease family)